MRKYDFALGDKIFSTYTQEINQTQLLISIPKMEWSYLLRFDMETYNEFESERNKMVRSLLGNNKLQYGEAEKLVDLINEWI
ncbi:YueH family protein [Bacillus sp. BP-3]|uniref:YueH family protein n=1 Tax=Bacillus sp. BP-3 TaxID=3022773 RepID=UPI00232CF769|nr:YueH family protein [Bacillus sp. BP-3]MDC2867742.1 YueH family protein [Bacillus sp. BP-3]